MRLMVYERGKGRLEMHNPVYIVMENNDSNAEEEIWIRVKPRP